MIKKIVISLILTIFCGTVYAAKVDSITVYSPSMKIDVNCIVVVPENIPKKTPLPVIYLLHGHGGNHKSWINGFDTEELVDKYNVIAVLPDGKSSWYWDSPIDPKLKYETFISKELVEFIDEKYPTIANRNGRAITGFSMGGQGALYNAIKNQEVFGAAGSMSGGVDIRPFPLKWNMAKSLGAQKEYPENWETYTVINLLHLLEPDALAIIVDCGTEDFFYEVNENLHKKLLYLNIPHRYITDSGAHNFKYWKNAEHYHFLFFDQFFKQNN